MTDQETGGRSLEEYIIARNEAAEKLGVVGEALTTLTETEFRRLCLRVEDGLTYEQIAELEGVARSTAYFTVTRARTKLRRYKPDE